MNGWSFTFEPLTNGKVRMHRSFECDPRGHDDFDPIGAPLHSAYFTEDENAEMQTAIDVATEGRPQ